MNFYQLKRKTAGRCREVSINSRFLLAGKKLLKKAKPHEVAARAVLFLPLAFRQAAIKALQDNKSKPSR